MNNDGLDGIVIGKLLELGHDLLGRENYAIEFDHGDLGAEAGKRFFVAAAAKAKVDKSDDGRCKESKQSAAHQKPYPDPRTPFSHNQTSLALVGSRHRDRRSG